MPNGWRCCAERNSSYLRVPLGGGALCFACLHKKHSAAAKLGIFVKGEDCIESMAMAETMVFDKTGTITEGRYVITDVFPVNMTERELLTTAASAEIFSRHPIAYALREAVGIRSAKDMKVTQVEEIPGRGVAPLSGMHWSMSGTRRCLRSTA